MEHNFQKTAAGGTSPHDLMRMNMVKSRVGAKKNIKMGIPGGKGGAMHHHRHGPPAGGLGMNSGAPGFGAGTSAPSVGRPMGNAHFPTMGGF
jgi:hypothetical protein